MPELNDQINSSYDDAYQCEGDGVVDCTTTLAAGDIITIDIDAIQTTAAKGLTVRMTVREA